MDVNSLSYSVSRMPLLLVKVVLFMIMENDSPQEKDATEKGEKQLLKYHHFPMIHQGKCLPGKEILIYSTD